MSMAYISDEKWSELLKSKLGAHDAFANLRVPVKPDNPSDYQYATWISDRRPAFKIHRTVGHAHNAVTSKFYLNHGATSDIILYTRMGAEWMPVEAWRQGDRTRPSWLPPLPDPAQVRRANREKNFQSNVDSISRILAETDEFEVPELAFMADTLHRLARHINNMAQELRYGSNDNAE